MEFKINIDVDFSANPRFHIGNGEEVYIMYPHKRDAGFQIIFEQNDIVKNYMRELSKALEKNDEKRAVMLQSGLIELVNDYSDRFNFEKIVGVKINNYVLWLER